MNRVLHIFAVFALVLSSALGGEFYEVQKIEYLAKAPQKGMAVYIDVPIRDNAGKATKIVTSVFVPCLAVRVVTEEQVKASNTFAKVYFYDGRGKLIEKVDAPSSVARGRRNRHAKPVFFPKGKAETIFFAVPEKVLGHKGEWSALVVFGDKQGVHAALYPARGMITGFDFPEKELYLNRGKAGPRQAFMNPLIEHVVKTNVPEQPKITLFLRPPIGMTDASEAKGVLAMCITAPGVEEIRRKLQGIEPGEDLRGLLKLAEKHKLIILCWGSRGMRQPGTTWDEIDRKTNARMEKIFDEISDKWNQGIDELVRKYGLPDKHFLLWGGSDAGQYSLRLAMRKPERFLAVHSHIPNGFDAPRPEGNRVLWLLTMGELDFCYERSLRFLNAARKLGYPITYKAIPGMGHSSHQGISALGERFFDWALTIKEEREAFDKRQNAPFGRPLLEKADELTPWPELYRNPPFVGDVVNQEMFPLEKSDMVPAGFRVSLPTKKIAESWNIKGH